MAKLNVIIFYKLKRWAWNQPSFKESVKAH